MAGLDRDALRQLLAWSDVLIHSHPRQRAAARGLAAETLGRLRDDKVLY